MRQKQYNVLTDQKEEQMPEYIVSVIPPKGVDAEPFDIPEWDYDCALDTARRYRDRGWDAHVADYDERFNA